MPELPEMQALAERLDSAVANATLEKVTALQFSSLKTVTPEPNALVGLRIKAISRRAKYLIATFEPTGGSLTSPPRLLIHLSQGGRVDLETPAKSTKPKNGVVRLTFSSVAAPIAILIKEFGHERKAAWWVLGPGDNGPLDRLGPEIDSGEAIEFLRVSNDSRRVHTILRDQRSVAGMGRGYTNDALHRACISPYATLASLNSDQRERLIEAIKFVLETGLAHERQRKGGLPPKVGDHWIVHHRMGEPCPTCGDTLKRVSYESYEITYCPACQTDGKLLADRRMSRLLR